MRTSLSFVIPEEDKFINGAAVVQATFDDGAVADIEVTCTIDKTCHVVSFYFCDSDKTLFGFPFTAHFGQQVKASPGGGNVSVWVVDH